MCIRDSQLTADRRRAVAVNDVDFLHLLGQQSTAVAYVDRRLCTHTQFVQPIDVENEQQDTAADAEIARRATRT